MDVSTRIAERSRIAQEHMRGKGWLRRQISAFGLVTANTIDRLTGWADDNRIVFMGATAAGLWRGAIYGGIAGILLLAVLPLGAFAPFVFFGALATGALGYGVYDGQNLLERHINRGDVKKFSDTVAEKTGAVPAKEPPQPKKAVEEEKREEAQINQKVEKVLAENPEKTIPTFTKREDVKRKESAAAIQL